MMKRLNNSYRMPLAITIALAGTLALTGLMNTAFAQAFPASANPGLLVPDPTRQNQPIPYTTTQQSAPPQSTDTQLQVPQAPANTTEVPTTEFTANQILVDHSTLLTPQQIQTLVTPYQGRTVNVDELKELVQKITAIYYDKGYLTTQAYIPTQDVGTGIVHINVVEGRIGQLCYTGNKFYRTGFIQRQLDYKPNGLLNIRELEKALNKSNRRNEYQLKAVLSPGQNPGETNVTIQESERLPFQVSPTFDNQGRPFIGTYRAGVELADRSLFGIGDQLSTKFIGASHTQIILSSYSVPVNRNGDRITASYGYSHVNVHLRDVVDQPSITGSSNNFGLLYSHPFGESHKFVGDVGLNARVVDSTFAGDTVRRDQIRDLQAGLSYDNYDRLGRTFARAQLTTAATVLGGNVGFVKGEGYLTRLFALPLNNSLLIRGYGLLSPNHLPVAEELQIGGAYSVRGYSEGLLLGDRGYNITVEERAPFPFLGRISPKYGPRIQTAVFFDIGQAFLDSSNIAYVPGVSGNSQHTLLVGTGVGLRIALTQYLQGFIDLGFGLVNRSSVEPYGQPTARIHFGIRSDLISQTLKPRGTGQKCLTPSLAAAPVATATTPTPSQSVSPLGRAF